MKLIRAVMSTVVAVVVVALATPAYAEVPPEPPSWDEFRSRAVTKHLKALDDPHAEVLVLKTLPVLLDEARADWEEWKASYDENVAWEEAQEAAETAVAAPVVTTAAPTTSGDIYDALAMCESTMTNANTGNGYYGYFQFLPSTWNNFYPGLPTDYPYGTQKQAAIALIAAEGWDQFPHCAAQLGML
jgi:hypothetical protein